MSINRWMTLPLLALATFALHAADVNYTKSVNADDNWWTLNSWSGTTWANSTLGSDSKATINVGNVGPTIQVINASGLANSEVELADLTVKGSNGAFTIAGSNMTFTSAAPYIDITGMKDAASVLKIRNVLSSDNPIVFRSVGLAPASTAGGGISFEKAPNLGTIRMQSGNLLLLDAAVMNAFADTVILDGGGICSQNNNHFYGFPLKIGTAGGWWRTYGSANMVYGGVLSDEASGITGAFRHTDGGIMTLTNTLADFSGTLRNEGGTLKLAGAALNYSGAKVVLNGGGLDLGNNDIVTDYTFDVPIEGNNGTLVVNLAGGTVTLPNEIKINTYLDKKGSAKLELVGDRARTSAAGGLSIFGGTVEMKAGSFTGTGALSIKANTKMWMTGGTAVFGDRMETQDKAAYLQDDGDLTALRIDVGNGTNTINGGVLRAGHLNMVDGSGRFAWFIQNGGNVSLTTTNTTADSPFRIGHWGSGKGTLILNNGEFKAENLNMVISWDSPGQVDVNNGVLKAHTITVGNPTRGNQAIFNLHGGTLVVGAGGIVRRASNTSMNFNGGTIASAAPFSISGPLTLGDSIDDTVIFDASNGVITAIGAITGTGTLVKRGADKFVFSDLQTSLQVDDGKVQPTSYTVSLPKISSTSASATFDVKLASTAAGTSTKYTAAGDISLADGTAFDVTFYQGDLESGVPYTLMESTGGTITTNGALDAPLFDTSRSTALFTLSPDSKKLLLTITDAPTSVYWKNTGATGDWNLDDINWSQNSAAATPDEAFHSLDSVVFNDISSQSAVTVTITPATVVPRSMVVENSSATEYQIDGTGIYGGTSLTKSGAGTLKISAPWLSSGAIAVTGGTLDWQDVTPLSGAKLSVSSGATFKQNAPGSVVTSSGAALWSGAHLVLAAGTYNVAAGSNLDPLSSLTIKDGILRSAASNMSEPFTVTGTSGGVDFRQLGTGINNDISGKISGAGNLTVYGNGGTADGGGGGGSTKLSNSANDFIGDVILASGVIDAESGFGNADNAIVLNGGGTLRRSGAITINRDLLVGPNGGVLRCYGSLTHQQIWTKRFANWSEGVSGGTVSTIDGGTFQFTGDISGFTGAFRKPRGRLLVGNGGALPCDHMRWNSIYLEDERAAFNFSNSDFKVGFTTSGAGQFYKQGTGDLVWTNSAGLAHTGGAFIEGGSIKIPEPNQFADGSTVTISQGAVLERLNTSALGATGTRKIAGAGTFKLTIAAECGNGIFSGSTAFNGRLDLNCIGDAKLINITPTQFGSNATIRVNTGALWYIANNSTYPYKIEIAGIGNSEVSSGFGALRLEMDPTLSGSVTLIDDARIFGGATINGQISNGCAEPKTLTFGGAYAQNKTLNLNGGVVNGVAPMNLAFTHNNTYNFNASNSVAAVTNNNSTLSIKTDAQLWLSGSSGGNGTWKFENGAVLGIIVNGATAGSLNAAALTWNAGAKLSLTGLESATKMRIPVIKCPSASISGLPQLAAPLPQGWSLVRSENGGIATIDAVRANGTVLILR